MNRRAIAFRPFGTNAPLIMDLDVFALRRVRLRLTLTPLMRHADFMASAALTRAFLALLAGSVLARAGGLTTTAYFERDIQPVLKEYCYPCHSAEKHKGDFDMEHFASLSLVKRETKVWQGVNDQLVNGDMPPAQKPQPSAEQKERLLAWIRAVQGEVGREHAGDPGPVVLRRLSNAEYTYTLQDLTGIPSLQPAREFPVDGAAGEGFMNTGQALVMSPTLLTKYLDAGKEVASHLVLLPDGLRFSRGTTRRDWTEEIVARIKAFYAQFADAHGGEQVNLQGIIFETNEGGRLPVEKYLAATIQERAALKSGRKTFAQVAREQGVNEKYLTSLWNLLNSSQPSPWLDDLRARWKTAQPTNAAALAAEVAKTQKVLWKFNTVGHLGKVGGPKTWMEAVNPLATNQEIRVKIPETAKTGDVTFYLAASDAGDGHDHDFVVWQQPRLVAPGRPDLLLRDVPATCALLTHRREQVLSRTVKYLEAAAEVAASPKRTNVVELAAQYGLDSDALAAWLEYLGMGSGSAVQINTHFTNRIVHASKFDFVNGWGSTDTPLVLASSSAMPVRIPGNLRPHSVVVHPSPTLQAAVGWQAPEAANVCIEATINHAHPECGNGITWSLELRRGGIRRRLASGATFGDKEIKAGPFRNQQIQPGDLVSVLIGPKDGNHSCDLTAVELVIASDTKTWSLGADVSPDVLAANPHADRFGNTNVWHFYTEPDRGGSGPAPVIPPGSTLARWLLTTNAAERAILAQTVQKLFNDHPSAHRSKPDAKLYHELYSFRGPLLAALRTPPAGRGTCANIITDPPANSSTTQSLPFGHTPAGAKLAAADLGVQAPSVLEIHLPAELAAGCEFVVTGALEATSGFEGTVQLQVLTNRPAVEIGLLPTGVQEKVSNGVWTSYGRSVTYGAPVVVNENSAARRRLQAQCDEFRRWFPAALCYAKMVPVDEAVTLTLFHREDEPLMRLMLDQAQQAQLDRMWDELHFVSQDALTLVDAYEQLMQYATQDADPKVFEPLRKPIQEKAAALRVRLKDTELRQVDALAELAQRAYRRPLTTTEWEEFVALYQKLRAKGLPHDEAIRLTFARVLVAPEFLYRAEAPAPGTKAVPLNDYEIATRLSYFLWSSLPDAELLSAAASGKLHKPGVLAEQTRRMLQDDRVRRLATEFACQWIHVHDFDTLDEKSERHFPTFAALRGDMYEESIRFFTEFFQKNGKVTEILDADYTFLNQKLAEHYGIPGVVGDTWRRVDKVKQYSRGGILAQATVLAKQSGASRTSPILRGNWVAEALLGDTLPRPPKDVPKLPEEEGSETLTVRQLIEKHSTDPRCYKCHERIDAFGFSLEGYDSIGRYRTTDLAGRPVDTRAKVKDGTELNGLDGLRNYLLTKRRPDFDRQFSRKLLGYALGRAVQLSDGPLLDQMCSQLKSKDCRIGALVEIIVESPQFREIRGRDYKDELE